MADFDQLKARIAAQGDPNARVKALIVGLAERIKTTSNDQNVQRLARDLRDAAGDLAGSVHQ